VNHPQSSFYEDCRNDNLRKQAALIATGQAPFPENLTLKDQAELADLIISVRRERLLQYLARSIAIDIFQSDDSS